MDLAAAYVVDIIRLCLCCICDSWVVLVSAVFGAAALLRCWVVRLNCLEQECSVGLFLVFGVAAVFWNRLVQLLYGLSGTTDASLVTDSS